MDEISPLIPNILRNRYQLQPLNRRQAWAAIEEPARSNGLYASPNFGYDEAAIQEILDFLAGQQAKDEAENGEMSLTLRKREDIESFNLQILCQYIEEKILAEQQAAGFEVSPPFYNGKEGLEHEIRNFYQKQLQSLPEVFTRRTARKVDDREAFIQKAQCLIEESLVTPIGRRCSMVDDFLTTTWEVDQEFLDTLVDTRLLRKELRLDDYYYEISHDTLLLPILESRDARRRREKADEEKAELRERLAEETRRRKEEMKDLQERQRLAMEEQQQEAIQAELEAARKNRRLARLVSLFALSTLVSMVVFSLWVLYNWVRSVEKELQQAEFIVSTEAFRVGLEAYQNLASQPFKASILKTTTGKDIQEELNKVHRLQILYDTIVIANMMRGDSLFFRDNLSEALTEYQAAYDRMEAYTQMNDSWINPMADTVWRIQPAYIKSRCDDLYQRRVFALNAIIAQFKLKRRAAEEFAEAGGWGQALRIFKEMEALLPDHDVDLEKLQLAMSLNQSPRDYIHQEIRKCQAGLNR